MSRKKQILIKILRFLPMIAVMAMIFAFSAMPGDESGETSGTFVKIVVRAVQTITNEPVTAEGQEHIHFLIRKAAHFTEFMILGMTAVLAYYSEELSWISNFLIPSVIAVLYAASDEFHQMFVPGRGPAVTDVGIDACGAVTGVLIILLILWIVDRVQSNAEFITKY